MPFPVSHFLFAIALSLVDSFRRASISACAAFRAHVGVDMVDVTLRDSPNRAFVDASAASNAIVTNYVSHFRLYLS